MRNLMILAAVLVGLGTYMAQMADQMSPASASASTSPKKEPAQTVARASGRSGAPAEDGNAKLFAVDKASGKQLGAVTIPRNSSAVPMTFMHQGKQYIVVAIGGQQNPAELVALALPSAK